MEDPRPTPVPPTPESFGVMLGVVLDMQKTLGGHIHDLATLNANYDKDHEDFVRMQETVKSFEATVKAMTRTMKFGWTLLIVIGGASVWTFVRIWEIFIPFLQMKLGVPIK